MLIFFLVVDYEHSNNDCFLVVIFNHGVENKLWAADKSYTPQKILEQFTAERCRTLAGE